MITHIGSTRLLRTLAWCGCIGLAGCSVLPWPTYEAPKLDLPSAPAAAKPLSIDRQWWKLFADPELDRLVADALIHNLDLATAAANIAEARANLASISTQHAVRVDGGGRISVYQRQFNLGPLDVDEITTNSGIGAQARWEWDLWERIKQSEDAALARLAASEHTGNAVKLSISYAVTETYFQLLALERKLEVMRDSQRSLKEITDLEFRRWKAQVGTELAYRQSVAELAATEARIPPLEVAVARTALALQNLVGRSARTMTERVARADKLPVLPDTPKEFDSALMLRRPDVASAEQLLVAAHADINAIQAERYPRLTVAIIADFLLTTTSKAISGIPVYWDITGGLAAPLYDGGLIDTRVEGAQARRDKAEAQYRYAVSVAFRETYEALLIRDATDVQLAANLNEVDMRRKSVTLTERSYEAGRSSKYEVLTDLIKLYNAQLAVVDARLNQYVARALLYKALGGGF